jgi:hypothetical protein
LFYKLLDAMIYSIQVVWIAVETVL